MKITNYTKNEISSLSEKFLKDGYVKLEKFFTQEVYTLLHKATTKLVDHTIERSFVMGESGTPRRMSTLGADKINDVTPVISKIYNTPGLADVIGSIAQSSVYNCIHTKEQYVLNVLKSNADTHGWHLDDPAYALVIVLKQDADSGANVEIINDWENVTAFLPKQSISQTIQDDTMQRKIKTLSLVTGQAYLLHAGCALHRVTELKSGERWALNFAFHHSENQNFGNSADLLYA